MIFHVTFVNLLLYIHLIQQLPGGPLPLPELCMADLIGAAIRQALSFTARLLRDAFTNPHLGEGMLLAATDQPQGIDVYGVDEQL